MDLLDKVVYSAEPDFYGTQPNLPIEKSDDPFGTDVELDEPPFW